MAKVFHFTIINILLIRHIIANLLKANTRIFGRVARIVLQSLDDVIIGEESLIKIIWLNKTTTLY